MRLLIAASRFTPCAGLFESRFNCCSVTPCVLPELVLGRMGFEFLPIEVADVFGNPLPFGFLDQIAEHFLDIPDNQFLTAIKVNDCRSSVHECLVTDHAVLLYQDAAEIFCYLNC